MTLYYDNLVKIMVFVCCCVWSFGFCRSCLCYRATK